MAAGFVATFLLALCASSQLSAAKIPTAIKNVVCGGSATTGPWPHGSDQHDPSTAFMECDETGFRVVVESPSTATRVYIRALNKEFEPIEALNHANPVCSSINTANLYNPTPAPAVIVGPGVVVEPAQGNAPVQDPFFDYLEQIAEEGAKEVEQFSRTAKASTGFVHSLALRNDQCGVNFNNDTGAHEVFLLVEEYLYVDEQVQLVSRTYLAISCDVVINQPGPDVTTPTVGVAEAEVCSETTYSLNAVAKDDQYKMTVTAVKFPTEGNLGFYINTLTFSEDNIISDGDVTAVGSEINSQFSPGVCSGNANTYYTVLSEQVVAKPSDQVVVNAQVAFCKGSEKGSCTV